MHLLGSKAQNIISICFSSEISLFNISAIPSGIALILQASEYVGHLTHTHFFRLDLVLATVPIYIPPHSVFKLTLSYCFLNKHLLRHLLQFLIRHIFYMRTQHPAVTKWVYYTSCSVSPKRICERHAYCSTCGNSLLEDCINILNI